MDGEKETKVEVEVDPVAEMQKFVIGLNDDASSLNDGMEVKNESK
jgi:hypothetical protein